MGALLISTKGSLERRNMGWKKRAERKTELVEARCCSTTFLGILFCVYSIGLARGRVFSSKDDVFCIFSFVPILDGIIRASHFPFFLVCVVAVLQSRIQPYRQG